MKRIHVGKAPLDVISAEDAALYVLDRVKNGIRTCVAPVNSAIIVAAETQQTFVDVLEKFDLLLADGFWPALSASYLYRLKVPHSNTSPFLRALFRQAGSRGLKVFLLGARSDVVAKAASDLKRYHPNAEVVGYENGYFDLKGETRVVDLINASDATVVLVGISSPKKELFIQRCWDQLKVPLSIGVGGQFDIWGGQTKEAPDWVRRRGFEWFFRLVQEPKRLFRRYTTENVRFLLIVFKQAFHMLANGGRQ